MKQALLWVHHKEHRTKEHIRQINALISDFTRMQVDGRKQMTLEDMGFQKGNEETSERETAAIKELANRTRCGERLPVLRPHGFTTDIYSEGLMMRKESDSPGLKPAVLLWKPELEQPIGSQGNRYLRNQG